jgi:hypothetical protein
MYALADPSQIRGILASAGWRDIGITPVHSPNLLAGGGTIDDAVQFLRSGSLGWTMLADADPCHSGTGGHVRAQPLVPYADGEGMHLGGAVAGPRRAVRRHVARRPHPAGRPLPGGRAWPTRARCCRHPVTWALDWRRCAVTQPADCAPAREETATIRWQRAALVSIATPGTRRLPDAPEPAPG